MAKRSGRLGKQDELSIYQNESVRFAYPTGWAIEEEISPEGTSLILQSPGVSFAIVGIFTDELDPMDLVEQTIESLREEHPTLEAEMMPGPADDPAVAMEAMFISLDMVSYCWVRGWQAGGNSLLVMLQSIEPESEQSKAVFHAICKSLQVTKDEGGRMKDE